MYKVHYNYLLPFIFVYYRKHVVFGKLVQGHEFLKRLEAVETDDTRPIHPVKIVDCGETAGVATDVNGILSWP